MNEEKYQRLLMLMEGNGLDQNSAGEFSVAEIRYFMNRSTIDKGKATCACCNSIITTYKRSVSYSQVLWLCLLNRYSRGGKQYVDHKKISNKLYELFSRNASDAVLMVHWGLIFCDPENPGKYKITEKGIAFINGAVAIPKYLFFTNNRCWKQSQETILASQTKNFNIQDIKNLTGINEVTV